MNYLGFIGDIGSVNRIGIIGLLFSISAFVPIGVYHFVGEANIVGMLWNIMLPTGWLDIAVGAILLFHEKIGLSGKKLKYLMLLGGLLSIVLFYIQDIDFILSSWHGVKGDYDIDGKSFITAFPIYAGLISILTALLIRAKSYPKNDFS